MRGPEGRSLCGVGASPCGTPVVTMWGGHRLMGLGVTAWHVSWSYQETAEARPHASPAKSRQMLAGSLTAAFGSGPGQQGVPTGELALLAALCRASCPPSPPCGAVQVLWPPRCPPHWCPAGLFPWVCGPVHDAQMQDGWGWAVHTWVVLHPADLCQGVSVTFRWLVSLAHWASAGRGCG